MHISYAADAYLRMSRPKHSPPLSAQRIVAAHAAEREFLNLADALGNEKASSIVATIRGGAGSKYAKVTEAQKHALAGALLAKHGTALAVYASAFNVDEESFLASAE